MIRLLFIFFFIYPLTGIAMAPVKDSISVTKKEAYDKHRIKKVAQYHSNGERSTKGKEKRFYESLGCLGLRPIYKKKGRWKYYDNEGNLTKVIVFKKGKQEKVILK